jgi:hypothetical protein
MLPNGSLDQRKARWVMHGFTQRAGIDFNQTFSLVVKQATIHTVLHLAASRDWPVHQLDVKNVFLHDELAERIYYQQPTKFVDKDKPDHVYLLSKSLYGLKQAPRAWFQTFAGTLHTLGFLATGSDSSLFVYKHGNNIAYLLLYVDDIVPTTSSTALLKWIISHLSSTFAMKDLGPIHFFLGIQVLRTKDGFFLNQAQYVEEILDHVGMVHCKPAVTPVDTKPKVAATDGHPTDDASAYRSIAGAL